MKSFDFFFMSVVPLPLSPWFSYPGLVTSEKNRNELLLAPIATRPHSPFSVIALFSFFSIARYIFIEKLKRKKPKRESEWERAINVLLSVLVVDRCSPSLSLFVALIIHYDMIGERLILLLCGKAIFLSFVRVLCPISFYQFAYLMTTIRFYYHAFKNSRSSWQYHLSGRQIGIAESERERDREMERNGKEKQDVDERKRENL